jgi:hypothetical protein
LLNRFRKSARAISRWGESANRHFKTSPGGNIPSSSLNLPVLPPLSTMETIEFISISFKSLKPDRSAYWPLPPPMVVIFIFGTELPNDDKIKSRALSAESGPQLFLMGNIAFDRCGSSAINADLIIDSFQITCPTVCWLLGTVVLFYEYSRFLLKIQH